MKRNNYMPVARQVQLLLAHTPQPNTEPYTLLAVAQAIGVSKQTLSNIVNGRSDNPLISTLRGLCEFYNISLEYFDCVTEDECLNYLAAQQLKVAPPLVQQIHSVTSHMTPRGRRNILSALEWIWRGASFKNLLGHS
jgi:transcriptional regulator with XRE-family HTH domain